MLCFMAELLGIISPADKILQGTKISLREALPVIDCVVAEINKLDGKFGEIFAKAENPYHLWGLL